MYTNDLWIKTTNRKITWQYVAIISAGILCAIAAGCGPSLGAWMYTLGLVPKQKVEAEYKLPPGPILILVDDDMDLIQPPLADKILVDELAKKLQEQGISEKVTTNEEIAKIRQQEPKFDQRGAREIGQLANADTVILIRTKQFYINKDLETAISPAKFFVEVKAINAQAATREEVRLWPPLPREGKTVDVEISPHDIIKCKTRAEAHEKLAKAMADKIAKLFYDYEIDPYK